MLLNVLLFLHCLSNGLPGYSLDLTDDLPSHLMAYRLNQVVHQQFNAHFGCSLPSDLANLN